MNNQIKYSSGVLFFILLFYIWTATYGYFDFGLNLPNNNYYNILADGFLQGRLDLPVKIPEKLLKAKDPFDPEFNKEFRQTFDQLERRIDVDDGLLDLSFYKKKIYMYFAPSPIFAIYLPYRFLTGHRISDSLALTILCFGIVVFSFLILSLLQKNHFSSLPMWSIPFCTLVIGFSNVSLYLLRRPAVYGVAICGGTFFLLGAIYFIFKSLKSEKQTFLLFLSGLFMAFAVGARPNLLTSCCFLIFLQSFQESPYLSKKNILNTIVLSTPVLISLLLLMLYNHSRFGNITDFGYLHQLSSLDFDLFKYKFFDLKFIPLNSLMYLFFPPLLDSHFPFIRHGHFSFEFQPEFYTKSTGILYAIPFLFMFFFYLLAIKRAVKNTKLFPRFEFLLLFGCGIINFLTVSSYLGVNVKYVIDFISLLLLALCILLFFCLNSISIKSEDYKILSIFSFILGIASVILGILFSIEGQFTGLKIQNPEQYKIIESIFN